MTKSTFCGNVIQKAVIKTEKLRSFLLKLCGVLFTFALLLCLINPVWRARDSKVDEYRDLYRYRLTAQRYYRVVHSSIYNLNVLAAEMDANGTFNTLTARPDLLNTDDELTAKIGKLYATLRTIPDPGDRSLVSAVYDCQAAYAEYRDLVFSGAYHDENYRELLQDSREKLRKIERDLFYDVYDK